MIKLVVVDDHEAMREGLVGLLVDRGLDVTGTAASGSSAIDTVRHAQPDVVLLDASLPDMPASEVARQLTAEHPGIFVLLYGDPDPIALDEGFKAGVRGYALKRGPAAELVGAIEQVASGRTFVDPRVDRRATPRDGGPPARLSPREREVLALTATGLTAEDVGAQLGVSVETVRTHTRNAVRKLGARNRLHAVVLASRSGEIPAPD